MGFDEPDPLLFREGNLDSIIIPNSREMGSRAVQNIAAQLRGNPIPAEVKLKPLLVTRGNLDSPQVREVRSMEWWLP